MSTARVAGIAAAALLISASGFAQSNSKQTSSSQNRRNATASSTTVVGCVMKESDYRRAHGLGKGTVAGAGLGDEYVLVDASVMPAASTSNTANASSGTPAASSSSTSASCADTGTGTAYRTTGRLERGLKPYVGQRVAVTGHFQHVSDANATVTPGKLPAEIVVVAIRPAPAPASNTSAAIAPAASEPAPSTPEPASVEAQNNAPENPAPVGTSGTLPKTAGEEPLIALIGMLSMGAGLGLRLLRRGTR